VSLDECETIITNLKRGYPRLVRWQEEVKKRAGFRKYTETWLGRRRNIPEIASPDWSKKAFAERVAMNTPIQGTAADILKLAIGRIVQGLPERPWLRPLLQIHDELVFEIQGFRSLSGKKTWSDTLHDALVDHYGQEVLAALHADAVDLIPWSQLLIQRKTHLLYPMYYLLLMRFLAGSAENFYGGQHGMAHPYGQGPWPCRNPVCRYYLKDVIVDLPMVPHGSMWRATFSCPHCGFVYRRKQPLPKREQYAGQIDIVNRGPLWLDAFRKMMEEGAPYYRIAETLQCYFNTVKRLAVEQGFLPADQCPPSRHYAYPRRAKSATLPPAAHPPDYRELLLQAMRDHPGASRTFLIKNYPEAYCWLRANDVAWYEANAPASRVNTPADWVAKDEETLQKAMKAIAYLRKLPGRPVWINRRSVEKYGGIHNLYKNLCDGKLPNTQNLLDSNTETREDWSKRKIQWAIKTMMDEGKRLHLPQIQVCASISHKFFEPLIPFVLDFIEELQN
jgi:hypothetical protein